MPDHRVDGEDFDAVGDGHELVRESAADAIDRDLVTRAGATLIGWRELREVARSAG